MKKKRLYIYCFLILIAILAIVFYSMIQPLILHPKFINACYEGDLEFVSNNIERIDLDHRDSYGRTGLMLAAWKGHYDIVRLLMDHGASLFAEDNDGDTALRFAAIEDSERCLKVIYDAMINSLDKENASIERLSDQFRILALYGFDYYVRDLLSKGMRTDAGDKDDWLALNDAIWEGHVDVVETLLDFGAEANEPSCGVYPIDVAVLAGNPDIVEKLIDAGAYLNVRSEHGDTPLLSAVRHDRRQILRILLRNGANPDDIAPDSLPALIKAFEKGHYEIAEILLEHGALLYSKYQGYECPMEAIVVELDNKKCMDFLKRWRVKRGKEGNLRKSDDDMEVVFTINGFGVLLNRQDPRFREWEKAAREGKNLDF